MDSNDGDRKFPPLTSYLFTVIMAVCMIVFFYLSFVRYRKRKHTARTKEAEYIQYVMLGRPGSSRSQLGRTRARSLMTNTHFPANASVWTMDDTFTDDSYTQRFPAPPVLPSPIPAPITTRHKLATNPAPPVLPSPIPAPITTRHKLATNPAPPVLPSPIPAPITTRHKLATNPAPPVLPSPIPASVPTQYKLANPAPEYTHDEEHSFNVVDNTDTNMHNDTQKGALATNADVHNADLPTHPTTLDSDVQIKDRSSVIDGIPQRKNKSKKPKKWKHMKKKMQSDSRARERFENLIGAYRSMSLDIAELHPISDADTNNDTSAGPRQHSEPYLPNVEHEHMFYKRSIRLNTNTYYSDDSLPVPKATSTRRKHRPLPQLDNVYFQNMNSRRWSEGSAQSHTKRTPKYKQAKHSSADTVKAESPDITDIPPMRRSMTMPETTLLQLGDKSVYSSHL